MNYETLMHMLAHLAAELPPAPPVDSDGGTLIASLKIPPSGECTEWTLTNILTDSASMIAAVDQVTASRPDAMAMAMRMQWAPEEDEELLPAWTIVATARGDGASACLVKQDVGPDEWYELVPPNVPWFALSSAAGMREAMNSGALVIVKNAGEEHSDVLRTPDEVPDPFTDDRGLI